MVLRPDSRLSTTFFSLSYRAGACVGRRSVELLAGQITTCAAYLRRRQHGVAVDERVVVPAGRPTDAMTDIYSSLAPSKYRRDREEWRRAETRKRRLVGKRFGMLVVLRRYSTDYWECRCDCGREKTIHRSNLHAGNVKTCGNHRPIGKRHFRAKQWSPEHRAKLSVAKIGNQNAKRRSK